MPELPRLRAARLAPPSWRDGRLLAGVLLVLGSTVAGAKLVAAMDDTVPVYAAAQHIVPGQPITADQLKRVDVALADATGAYVSAGAPISPDAVAVRDVRPGELVPASAVGRSEESTLKPVMLPVEADGAAVLVPGSVVDVWVNQRVPGSSTEAYGTPSRVLGAASVARAAAAESGRFAAGRATVGVQVMVPAEQVEKLIAAVDQGARITLVPVLGSPLRPQG